MMLAIDLFSGCGGLALGLELAAFEHVCLVEQDPQALNTLRANFDPEAVMHGDVTDFIKANSFAKFKDQIDLLSGGPPCQAFSYAGTRKGLRDSRGRMIYQMIAAAEQIKPKAILIENVKGLASVPGLLGDLVTRLDRLGYRVDCKVLNANDYGVAQNRDRLFILGYRNDLAIQPSLPQRYAAKPVLIDALKDCPQTDGDSYSDRLKAILDLVPPGGNWRDLPNPIKKEHVPAWTGSGGGNTGLFKRLAWHEPSLTLLCKPIQKQSQRCHPDHTRPLTIGEYARIQSFPDSFKFEGSKQVQYRQIGNAVPVELARAIGEEIAFKLFGKPRSSIRREPKQQLNLFDLCAMS